LTRERNEPGGDGGRLRRRGLDRTRLDCARNENTGEEAHAYLGRRCGAGSGGAIGGLPGFSREGEGGERKKSGWSDDRLLLADRSVEEREREAAGMVRERTWCAKRRTTPPPP
jgi:hypothetical protein